MILKYTGSNDWGRSELDYGTRVYVPTNWRTNDLGNVSKAAIPEIRESLRDMGIRLSFNNDPFAVACFDDVLLFWEKAQLRGVEFAKIACARKLFNDASTSDVRYGAISNYDTLLNIIQGA